MQHIQSSLVELPLLVAELDNNVREYQAITESINKCNSTVCTLGHIYADVLFQNSSVIVKYVLFI